MPSYATLARANAASLLADAAHADLQAVQETVDAYRDQQQLLETELVRIEAAQLLSLCSLPTEASGGGQLTLGSVIVCDQYTARLYTLLAQTMYGWVVEYNDGSDDRGYRSLDMLTCLNGKLRIVGVNGSGRAYECEETQNRSFYLIEGSAGMKVPKAGDVEAITALAAELLPSANDFAGLMNGRADVIESEIARLQARIKSHSRTKRSLNEASRNASREAAHAAMFAFVEDYAVPVSINGVPIKRNQTFAVAAEDGTMFVAGAAYPTRLGFAFSTGRAGSPEFLLERDGQLHLASLRSCDELRYGNQRMVTQPVRVMPTVGHEGQMGAGTPTETVAHRINRELGDTWQLPGVNYSLR